MFKGAEVFYDPDDDIDTEEDSPRQDDDDIEDDEEDISNSPVRPLPYTTSAPEVATAPDYLPSFSSLPTAELGSETRCEVSPHSLDDVVEAVAAVEEADQLLYKSSDKNKVRTVSCDSGGSSSSSCHLPSASAVVEAPSLHEMDSLLSSSEQEEDCAHNDWMTLHASLDEDTPSFDTASSSLTAHTTSNSTSNSSSTTKSTNLSDKIDSLSRAPVTLWLSFLLV